MSSRIQKKSEIECHRFVCLTELTKKGRREKMSQVGLQSHEGWPAPPSEVHRHDESKELHLHNETQQFYVGLHLLDTRNSGKKVTVGVCLAEPTKKKVSELNVTSWSPKSRGLSGTAVQKNTTTMNAKSFAFNMKLNSSMSVFIFKKKGPLQKNVTVGVCLANLTRAVRHRRPNFLFETRNSEKNVTFGVCLAEIK